MRLDRFLCDCGLGTRSRIKKDIRAGLVTVNGACVKSPEQHVNENSDRICYNGQPCRYEKYVCYMLYKPAGVISAVKDRHDKTVIDLMGDAARDDLFPVGRLDKDTEGLMLITNDGALAHDLLSPAKHVEKEYECLLACPIDERQINQLEQGVDIGDKTLTKPAKVRVIDGQKITLTITEGRFHQVKRMFSAVGNEVLYLKRLRMGALMLDETLEKGGFRRLTGEETESIYR